MTLAQEGRAFREMPDALYREVANGRMTADQAIHAVLELEKPSAASGGIYGAIKIRLHDNLRSDFPAKPWTVSVVGNSRQFADIGGIAGATAADALRRLADEIERNGWLR